MSDPNAHARAVWTRRVWALRALLRWLRGEPGAAEALEVAPREALTDAVAHALTTAERTRG